MDVGSTNDETYWLSIVERDAWVEVTDEQVAMAFQDLRRSAGDRLVDALLKEASRRLLDHVRRKIGYRLYFP